MTAGVLFDVFAQFAADPKLELEGTWVTIGPATRTKEDGTADEDSRPALLIARNMNRRHGRVISKLYEANKATLELKNDAADDKGEEITAEAAAKGVLLGWKNLSWKKEPLPDSDTMTPEDRLRKAVEMLSIKDFRILVLKHADDFKNFALVRDEADAGNSPAP
jgi:hypothetical protein